MKSSKRRVLRRWMAVMLSILMIVSILPTNVFANEMVEKHILSIDTSDLETEKTVSLGTSRDSLGLPEGLLAQVEEAEGVSKVTVPISWEGEYDSETLGDYLLTAVLSDSTYTYDQEMPSILIQVRASGDNNTTSGIMLLADGEDGQEINLVDINKITTKEFKVKPKGETEFKTLPLPEGTSIFVGDEVFINFEYSQIENASAANTYFFNIPQGLTAVANLCRGDIKNDDGVTVGSYEVVNDRIELKFNEDYLDDHGNTIDAGNVLFYGTLNQDALDNEGVIMLGDVEIGRVPIQKDPEVATATVKKWNGDGTVSGGGLVYDTEKGAVQYTVVVATGENNNTVINSIDVKDILTTTVNNVEDTSIVTGDYTDIVITPSTSGATFTKGADGNYVLHAENVPAGTTIKVTYWVPVKEGITQAHFVNDVSANKTVGSATSLIGGDSVQGDIANKLQVNKSAENPVYHVDEAAKTTTVTYTVTVKAPSSNTTDIANAYIEDEFTQNGNLVNSIKDFSSPSSDVSYDNNFTKGDRPKFTVQLGTMKPGETKTYTYTAVMDTDKCYMSNSSSDKWLDNWATAKSGNLTFDKSKAARNFKKEFTKKTGVYDPAVGAYKFTVIFDGLLPGKDSNSTEAADYYNGVLDFLDDEIQTKGKGYNYIGTPAPVLEAYRGPIGSAALETATLDGSLIDGKESFHIAVPQDMKGAYSYRLTYYVNLPADAQPDDVVKNTFKISLQGIGEGGADKTFSSSTSASYADATSGALNKELGDPNSGYDHTWIFEEDHKGDYASQWYTIKISAPVVENATLVDELTGGDIFDVIVPSDYLNENLKIEQGGKLLVKGIDYTLESVTDKSFKITFIKAIPTASQSTPVVISYKGQIVATETGKEVAGTDNGVSNMTPASIKNSATLTNGNAPSVTKDTDLNVRAKITKKSVDTKNGHLVPENVPQNELAWDIEMSYPGNYCAFGNGYHNLVDTIPADQELVRVEFYDNQGINTCSQGIGKNQYTSVVNDDGTTTLTINAFTGNAGFPRTYRIWTRIKADVLIDRGIDPDNFDNETFTNSAYYEANGTQWKVAADQVVSNHRFSKEVEYGSMTEAQGGVKFTLKVNTDGAELNEKGDTITVHDTMNPQLVLMKDSILINGKTIDQIPGAELIYTDESSKFDLILPDNTPFEITYIAEIDAEQGDAGWLSNEANIDGRVDTVKIDKTETIRLQVGAGASSKLTYFLKKTDKDGNLLKTGVAFSIAKVNGVDTFGTAQAMTLQENGSFKFRGIEKNSIYVLTETQTPDTFKTCDPIYIYFGTPNAELKTALEAQGITLHAAKTGGGADLENMFPIPNEDTTIDIPVEKQWDDGDDISKLRPDEITVNLTGTVEEDADPGDGGEEGGGLDIEALDDGNEHATLTLTAANGWKDSFKNLPTHKTVIDPNTGEVTRKPITYTVEEVAVDGYTTTIKGSVEDGFIITNSRAVPADVTLALSGLKTLFGQDGALAMTDGQFEFTLTQEATNPENGATLPNTTTVGVKADGTFDFENITFHKVGTYTFTVTEVAGDALGYTYDTKPVTVQVVVTNDTINNKLVVDQTTYMKDGKNATEISFENSYKATETGLRIPVKKTLTGEPTPSDKTFTFLLTPENAQTPMPQDGGTLDIIGAGNGSFSSISFDHVGTYTYTITEQNTGEEGYVYSEQSHTVVVTVVDDGGALSTSWSVDGTDSQVAEFVNTYQPSAVEVSLPISKTITGDTRPTEKTFTFTLTSPDGNPLPQVTEKTITVGTDVNASGNTEFGPITFTKAGTYQYTVTETNDGAPGFTYDTTHTANVVVTDDDGHLSAAWTVDNEQDTDQPLAFVNQYKPGAANLSLKVKKNITGIARPRGQEKQFTFELASVNNAPMPANNTVTITDAGEASFEEIAYELPGTYEYTITEQEQTYAGYTFDTSVIKVRVTVIDEDGTLTAKANLIDEGGQVIGEDNTAAEFTNNYAPEDARLVIPIGKVVTGNDRPEQKQTFTFELKENGIVLDTKTIEDFGRTTFDALTYSQPGTFTYTISEVNEGAHGYTYSTEVKTITVDVVDQNGILVLTWKVNGEEANDETVVSFTNHYEPDQAVISLNVTKTIIGNARPTENTFHFTMTAEQDAPLPRETEKDITVGPDEGAAGAATFGEIIFTKAGVYRYTITEQNDQVHGYTYDTEHIVTVTVVDEDGVLGATWTVDQNQTPDTDVVFVNSYTPDPVDLSIGVEKEITGNERLETLKKEFTFVLEAAEESEEVPLPDENTLMITDAGQKSFDPITFDHAGEYDYVIYEQKGTEPGYTYDENRQMIRVTVTDVDGVLTAKWNLLDENSEVSGQENTPIRFVNNYTPSSVKVALPLQKIVNGDARTDAAVQEFKFELKENGKVIDTVSIKDQGKTTFKDLEFDKVGTYTYTVSEVNGGAKGYTYDSTSHDVVITITDENGVLKASWTDNGKSVDNVTFTNTYKAEVPSGTLPKTGENEPMAVWMLLLAISGFGIAAGVLSIRRKRRNEQ